MAKVIVPRGPLGLVRSEIVPVQSRAIALELHLAAGVGNDDFCYTPTLGNRLWLHKIDIWCYCANAGVLIGGFFYIMFGTSIPVAAGEVATRWNRIVPLSCGQKPGFRWFELEAFHRSFTMARLFSEHELRFGVTIENGFNQQWEATVAFEISEG